jgi:hypothetical protein
MQVGGARAKLPATESWAAQATSNLMVDRRVGRAQDHPPAKQAVARSSSDRALGCAALKFDYSLARLIRHPLTPGRGGETLGCGGSHVLECEGQLRRDVLM